MDVKCNQGFVPVIKMRDNSPVCVKPRTAQKLVERGWGTSIKAAWFKFKQMITSRDDCKNIPWIRELVGPNASQQILMQSKTNVTLIADYFKNHEVTLLQVKYDSGGSVGNPISICGFPTYYFHVSQNYTSKMIKLGYTPIDEKDVQRSYGDFLIIPNTEQKVWFEFVPIQCHAPWDEYWFHNSPLANTTVAFTQGTVMNYYFKNNGIAIFDAKYLPKLTTAQLTMPRCGDSSETTFYFLVSESDSVKMIKMGYNLAKLPLPSYAYSIPFSFN